MTQRKGFLFKTIEDSGSARTYEVWNTTGQTYQIPESRIEPDCLPLEDGATGFIEQRDDGKWYWVRNE
jgi:hypothetical protein